MEVEVEIVNAFIDGNVGGNPAGLVLNADELDEQQKLKIAKTIGLSETAFVSKSDIATIKLEFFTPERQIAHCGHATIATFSRMRELNIITDGKMSKETIDGVREILVEDGKAYMEQKSPNYMAVSDKQMLEKIALSMGVEQYKIQEPYIINTGNSFLILPFPTAKEVKQIVTNNELITEISEYYDLIGFYVFSEKGQQKNRDATARMFAPRFGITEEAATGMAAAPLAAYLYKIVGHKQTNFLIEQGYLMVEPSPSVIEVSLEIEKGEITRITAGGYAKSIKTTKIEV